MRAARAASLFDPGVKHFNMQLLDEIDHLLLALGLQGLELHHQVADKPALMVHGSHFSELALEQEGAKIDAAAAAADGDEQLCAKKWNLVPSSADKAALIAHECFKSGSASELCAVAQSRRILWSLDDAERFKQAVALGEAKQAALAGAGFAELHAAQRVPATAPAALMMPAAAALPAPAGGAPMSLAPPIQSAGAGVVGAPRHLPVARISGPAPRVQLIRGPVQPAAGSVALGQAAAAVAASAAAVADEQQKKGRKRGVGQGVGGGRRRKLDTDEAEAKRREADRQRKRLKPQRKSKKQKQQSSAPAPE